MFPAADYLLLVNSSAQDNATVMFQYRNGERADETTCTVSLANATGAWLLAQNVSFYNSYYVNATLVVPLANLTDGNYSEAVRSGLLAFCSDTHQVQCKEC